VLDSLLQSLARREIGPRIYRRRRERVVAKWQRTKYYLLVAALKPR